MTMKNTALWQPSKYVYRGRKLIGSRNPQHLNLASRLQGDLVGALYQQYLPLFAKGSLADLGCGNVPLYAAYKDLVEDITCVDWPNSSHSHSYLDHACDLNQPLPLPTNAFDTLILSDVLEHIAEPQLLWLEMARILKPGGILLLNVPFYYRIHEAPHDYYRYTEFALKRFADKASLSVLVLKATGGAVEVLSDFMAKNVMRVPLIGKVWAIAIQWFCQIFTKTKIGARFTTKSSVNVPFGYFMIVQKSA